MSEDVSDLNKQRQALEQRVRNYIGPRGISADSLNPPFGVCADLRRPEAWSEIKPLQTYAEYTKDYIPAGMADYATSITNQGLVAQYDAVISRINLAIGDGIKTEKQKNDIFDLTEEIERIVRGENL